MSACLIPNKSLFSVIDKNVSTFMEKFRENNDDTLKGGAFFVVPIIVGVIVNLLTVNNNHYLISTNFRGISNQMKSQNNVKSLPKESDYDVQDYKRREQLFKLLTKGEFDDMQLQIYNSFDQPRKDQLDIQRCLYILTTSFFEYKYDNNGRDDKTIKSVIHYLFSNHLHILALIAYFINNDGTKKRKATFLMDEISEYATPIENEYKENDDFFSENDSAQRRELKKRSHTMRLRRENFPIERIHNSEGLTLEQNNPMRNTRVPYDVIPASTHHPVTRSQTRRRERNVGTPNRSVRFDHIPPNGNGWRPESHMIWRERTSGGTRRNKPRFRRSNKSNKKRSQNNQI
jgi:hypothetical protein